MASPAQMFMIRNKTTGLFSSGGSHPRFTKKGKVWKRKGDLGSHLTMIAGTSFYNKQNRRVPTVNLYADCEVVVLEPVVVGTQDIQALLSDAEERIEQKEKERKESMARYRLERAQREYEEAQKAMKNLK